MRSSAQYNHAFHYLAVVDIFLENEDNEVLMIKRDLSKKVLPGYYNGIGGKMEQFESPFEAITREVAEEAPGARISEVQLTGVITIEDEVGQWHVFIFRGKVEKASVTEFVSEDGKLEWVKKDDLMKLKLVPDMDCFIEHVWDDPAFFAKARYQDGKLVTCGLVEHSKQFHW